ncbi:FtsX-like permease family protein [Chenggangzhangella methanolivorans]|uniref:FtsX-like permease family protein n=1 Tax=Chenggangzhangella methanolivorans TaxID=1437009 RepID=UPI0021BD3010|nr:FtsX-like permease family protein [Chenggangzhangella methanolivorans]
MLVKDKGRDIAILRTMGATSGSVMRIFLITGASIGVVGTLAGFALGMIVLERRVDPRLPRVSHGHRAVLAEVYFLSKLPADPNARETASVVLMALFLSVFATLYPSWRAARLDPVEALRYE